MASVHPPEKINCKLLPFIPWEFCVQFLYTRVSNCFSFPFHEVGFCSANGKKKRRKTSEHHVTCVTSSSPLLLLKKASPTKQVSKHLLSCFVLRFGMTLELINNNANLTVPYSNHVLFQLIQLKKKSVKWEQ